MANSPAHRFGQVIGDLLEEILQPVLQEFADGRGLFLDKHGVRKGVRDGQKLSWEDHYGNSHDLDFVIEKAGCPARQGRPVAFIEAAWRRYTKHSRNKVQEIQGAVLPVAEKHKLDRPFLGAVLAGDFSRLSLNQLISHGFVIVHLPYESVVSSLQDAGISARFDEGIPDIEFERCADQIDRLRDVEREDLKSRLIERNKPAFESFFWKLREKLDRLVDRVTVLPLFGSPLDFSDADGAADFIKTFSADEPATEFRKYEIIVSFSNGDKIEGVLGQKERALAFLAYVTS